ncbi:MAG: hypothetical protein H7Z38_14960 [Rubrivivax sp.]|nr:hypothetical protein [Pyrinomonadaceae bacterium]
MGLDIVELFMAFEERFGIEIPDKDASELYTPRRVTDYVWNKVASEGMTREQVAAIVREVIIEERGITDFSDDSHFVDDMNMD